MTEFIIFLKIGVTLYLLLNCWWAIKGLSLITIYDKCFVILKIADTIQKIFLDVWL